MKFVEGDGNAILSFNFLVLRLCVVNAFDIVMIPSYSVWKCYFVRESVRLSKVNRFWVSRNPYFILTKSRILIRLLELSNLRVCLMWAVTDRMVCTFCVLWEVVDSISLVTGQEGI